MFINLFYLRYPEHAIVPKGKSVIDKRQKIKKTRKKVNVPTCFDDDYELVPVDTGKSMLAKCISDGVPK